MFTWLKISPVNTGYGNMEYGMYLKRLPVNLCDSFHHISLFTLAVYVAPSIESIRRFRCTLEEI